jgi:serine protease inhibitor
MRAPLWLFLSLPVLGSCGTSTDPAGPPPLLTQLPRELSPAERRLVDGTNAFTFDLVRHASKGLRPDSNLFLSPLSASMALAMALNGANGETHAQMQAALQIGSLTEPELNRAYQDLIALLQQLDSRTEMRIANSMWAREEFQPEPSFIETGRRFFDAEVRSLNFGSPSAVPTINDWVSGKTNGRIPRLLDEIRTDEVLFLINAIYFKGKWRKQFDPKDTRADVFHAADGRDRTAPLMHQEDTLWYHETEDYQAADLLYGNGAFAMTVLLPKPGRQPGDLLATLDPDQWRTLIEQFHEAKVNLTLPRFRLEYTRRLNADLQALGMEIPFDETRADFYRIADVRPDRLFLSRVDQKTFVEVNEEGTEAAAATAVGVAVTSAPLVVEMRVDRPFLFAIRERLSGTILFLGVMNVIEQQDS